MPSYSGVWTLQAQMQAEAAGNWPKPPVEGGLFSWGRNSSGALGLNDTADRSSPVQVGALTTWSKIALSENALATKTDGTLWSWGRNHNGQLGLNDTANRSSPVQIGALTTWSQIACGSSHSVATKTDGALWSWGNNNYGQLGLNDVAKRSSPVQIGALTSWYQVAAGSNFTLAIKTDGTMWSWGTDSFGALGLNTSGVHKSSPVQIGALTTWSQIASGTSFSLAIKTDGTMWSWGRSNNGQLGLGEGGAYAARSSPVQIGALTTWSKVVAGGEQSLAIKTDGTLWSWGSNSTGELGLNDAANRSSPVQIGALTTWSQIAGGNNHTLAIKTDKTLWSWGYNYAGKLGLNDVVARSSPVQVGVLATWLSLPKMPASNSSLAIKG